ncbi:MAG: hypothetical protein IPK82_18195 [Polyangiaceae bacterium]|nr:hypothetical protein [Polyangiaceae bacterium]
MLGHPQGCATSARVLKKSAWFAALAVHAACSGAASTTDPKAPATADTASVSEPAGSGTAGSSAAPTSSVHTSASSSVHNAVSPPPGKQAGANLPKVELVQVDRTKPIGKAPELSISQPTKNAVIPTTKAATFEARVGIKSGQLAAGDHLCVVLDKRPCKRVDDPSKSIPLSSLGALDEGQHVLSVLARRATGELYRTGKSAPFASVSFFVGKKTQSVHKDGAPMLFYTAPEKGPAPAEGVLIDFFLANAEVRSGVYIIAATVGGPGIESGVGMLLETDRPLRMKHAREGEYLSRLTLLEFVPDLGNSKSVTTVTYTSKPVGGPFGEVERSIFVTK